jgi:hypothetical protein
MGAAMTAQMATTQRLVLDHPPVAPEAPLASVLDADHITALHAQAAGMHNIRSLVPIVLDPASSHYPHSRGQVLTLRRYALADHVLNDLFAPTSPLWYLMDSVVLLWLHGTVTVELQAWLALEDAPPRRPVSPVLSGGPLRGRILPPNERHVRLSSQPRRAHLRPYPGAEPSVWSQPPLRPPKGSH